MVRSKFSKRRNNLSKRRNNLSKLRNKLSKRRTKLSKRRNNLSKRRSKVVKYINKRSKNYKNTNIYRGSFIGGYTEITVFYRGEGKSGQIEIPYNSTFLNLLKKICIQESINPDDYSLIYAGKGTNRGDGGLKINELDTSGEILEDKEMLVVLRKKEQINQLDGSGEILEDGEMHFVLREK